MDIKINTFIVRPFGIKQEIDFDKVEAELIQPALKAVEIVDGATTGKFMEAGNIREDMFSELLIADLVIADLSIHNANVFYELGIRHALRDNKTFLIRCNKDEIPFDLKTDRYLSYQANDPGASLQNLIDGLKATLLSNRKDSPVFNMLPKLEAQDAERFLAVPIEFGEEVEIGKVSKQFGKLALLAAEARDYPWQIPALRSIGEVQFRLKGFEDARITWEKVKGRYPDDRDANDRLATIYQRLAEEEMKFNPVGGWELLAKSDIAIKKLLDNYATLERNKRGEVYSLMGRNAKTRWLDTWKNVSESERQTKALQSTFLKDAYEYYNRGCNEDLNHFYSGINALGLLTVIISLAEALPEIWELEYDSKEDADTALTQYKKQHQKLTTIVEVSINSKKEQLLREGQEDFWVNMTEADLCCLTSKRPARVGSLYQKVIQEASELNFEAAKRQLLIYEQLNIVPDNVKAALEAFDKTPISNDVNKRHYLLFTGHMIDKPDREEPRFTAAKEDEAREVIKNAIQKEKEKIEGPILGIAGGACGGDILFHEVCAEVGIPTELYLALPREEFLVESVQFAGPQWIERFDNLYKKLPRKVLTQTKELPHWLQKKKGYSIWVRNNLWMMNSALVCGGIQMTLIALWDGKGGDSAGGTDHMVKVAKERGAKTIITDIKR